MPARPVATEPATFPDPDNDFGFGDEVMQLTLAPGTASGYKGVHKAGKKWEARLWIAGRGTRVVWRCASKVQCAFILAYLEVHPCDVPTPKCTKCPRRAGQSRARVRCVSACATAMCARRHCVRSFSQSRQARQKQRRAEAAEAKRSGVRCALTDPAPLSSD